MLKDVVDAGGQGLLVPAVLFALVLYGARGLFNLHGRRSQHRKEFLEQWNPQRVSDDLWLEVTIRHLYGTPLPAHVIRTALEHPHCSQALIELSELWPFIHYDPEKRSVTWLHLRHRNSAARRASQYWPIARYLLFALGAMFCTLLATQTTGLVQWIYATAAVTLSGCAFANLWYSDAEKTASKVGEEWINRINLVSRTGQGAAVPGYLSTCGHAKAETQDSST